ncbi:MAG: restriction endonuclease subunit S [Vicinamibacterales bacterium]
MSAWRSVHLGEVAEFIRGITFTPEDVVPVGTAKTVACLRTKNVQAELDLSDLWAVDRSFVKRPDQRLQPGDVLVSSANSWNLVGRCCWIPELPWDATFGGFVSVLRPDRERIDPRFLFNWFRSRRVQETVRSFGQSTTNISNLNVRRCLELPLSIPALDEQRRIAQVLDRAEAQRAKRRLALEQIDHLKQAVFLDLFGHPSTNPKGWPIHSVGDLLESASYGTSQRAASVGETPVLRMNNITRSGEVDVSDLKFMTLASSHRDRFSVRPGDLLFNRTNSVELVGKTGVVRESRPMAYAGYLIRLRSNNENVSEYLWGFLNSVYAKSMLRGMCKSIIGMANINATELQAMRIPRPPLALQRQFARQLAAIEKLKAAHRASLAQLDALFASLQHRAFRGEL